MSRMKLISSTSDTLVEALDVVQINLNTAKMYSRSLNESAKGMVLESYLESRREVTNLLKMQDDYKDNPDKLAKKLQELEEKLFS